MPAQRARNSESDEIENGDIENGDIENDVIENDGRAGTHDEASPDTTPDATGEDAGESVDEGLFDPRLVELWRDDASWTPPPRRRTARTAVTVLVVLAVVAGVVAAFFGGRHWERYHAEPDRYRQTSTRPQAVHPVGATDTAIITDLADHSDSAVALSVTYLGRGSDESVAQYARNLIDTRNRAAAELARLGARRRAGRDRALDWTGYAHRQGVLPGVPTIRQLSVLAGSSGAEADAVYVRLLRAHHAAGVIMAEAATRRATSPRVQRAALRLAAEQRAGIGVLDAWRETHATPSPAAASPRTGESSNTGTGTGTSAGGSLTEVTFGDTTMMGVPQAVTETDPATAPTP